MKRQACPLVSIVLVNFNGRKFVDQWRPLFLQDYGNYEMVFVDNGSRDGSEIIFSRIAKEHSSIKARILKLHKNCGYSRANNLGVNQANGKYVVLVSNDIKVTTDWLTKAIEVLDSDEQIGVAQSMMYTLDDPAEPDQMANYIDVFGMNHPFLFSNHMKEVFYCEGAVMFIRRQVINQTCGLFDDSYFMFYEDVDFCWRARLMGYKVVVLPRSIVYHRRGGTVPGTLMKTEPIYVYTNTRNRLNTLLKNYSATNVIKFVPLSITIEILKALLLTLSGKVQPGLASFKGIFAFVFGIPDIMKKRAILQKRRKITEDKKIREIMTPTGEALRDIIQNAKRLRNEWK